jgi:ribosomal protein S18 acetylase RimI-like enzyme
MEFQSLDHFTLEEIVETHNLAFSDYEVSMNLTVEIFKFINIQRSVDYTLSLGAVSNGKLIGFILNGIGQWDHQQTAYDAGTGVIPEFRNQGVGKKMLTTLEPILISNGISQYILEVIQTNENAIHLYKNQGFMTTRELFCYRFGFQSEDPFTKEEMSSSKYFIYDLEVISSELIQTFENCVDYPNSWQNSFNSILNIKEHLKTYYIVDKPLEEIQNQLGEHIIGFFIVNPGSGGIFQMGISSKHRRAGVATWMLNYIRKKHPDLKGFSMVNVDSRNKSLIGFLESYGFRNSINQYEMKKSLHTRSSVE